MGQQDKKEFKLPPDYNDVTSRILEWREKYPEGSLSQLSLEFVRDFGGKDWVVYTAAAYRTPDDPQPGVGTAWEEVPGRTPYTRDSEVQNAETAAWGRALIAVGAADAKKGIASKEEVRNRRASAADDAFIPSEEANELMGRIRKSQVPTELRAAWVGVEAAKKLGVISEAEYAVLKTQGNAMKADMEAKGLTDE